MSFGSSGRVPWYSNPPMGVPGNARAAIARYVPSGSRAARASTASRSWRRIGRTSPDSTRMRALGATESCSGVKLARKFSTW